MTAAGGSTWAAGSGVQRFWWRFLFEILTRRVVMDLLRSPSRVLIEIGDFGPPRRLGPVKSGKKGFFTNDLKLCEIPYLPPGASVSTTSPFSSTD